MAQTESEKAQKQQIENAVGDLGRSDVIMEIKSIADKMDTKDARKLLVRLKLEKVEA